MNIYADLEKVVNYMCKMINPKELREDCKQNAYLKCIETIKYYDDTKSKPQTFFRKTIKNAISDTLKNEAKYKNVIITNNFNNYKELNDISLYLNELEELYLFLVYNTKIFNHLEIKKWFSKMKILSYKETDKLKTSIKSKLKEIYYDN